MTTISKLISKFFYKFNFFTSSLFCLEKNCRLDENVIIWSHKAKNKIFFKLKQMR